MPMTSSGIIIVARIASSTKLAPRNRLRASAYAANALTLICSNSPKATMISEFSRPWPSPRFQAVRMLPVDSPRGQSITSPSFGASALNAVANIDHRGTTKIPATIAYSTTRTASRPPRRAVSLRGSRSPRALVVTPCPLCSLRGALWCATFPRRCAPREPALGLDQQGGACQSRRRRAPLRSRVLPPVPPPQRGARQDDRGDQEQAGDRRGVPGVVVGDRGLVHRRDDRLGGAARSAVGQHVDLGEHPQAPDQAQDQHDRGDRPDRKSVV